MPKPDSRVHHHACKHSPKIRFRSQITRLHPASSGLHQQLGRAAQIREKNSLETESFRKQFGDVSVFGPHGPLEEDGCVRAEFINDLTASAARRTRHSLVVDYRDRANLDVRTKLRYR